MAMSTGKVVALIQAMGGGADPAVIEAAVQDWLEDHPEATTTVQDGSITEQKLATAVAQKLGLISSLSDEIENEKSEIDTYLHTDNILKKADSFSVGVPGGTYQQKDFYTISGPFSVGDTFTFAYSNVTGNTTVAVRMRVMNGNTQIREALAAANKATITITADDITAGVTDVVAYVYASTSTPLTETCVVTNPVVYAGASLESAYTDAFKAEVNKLVSQSVGYLTIGELETDKYVLTTNGNHVNYEAYKATGYIPLHATKISVPALTRVANVGMAFYDSDRNYISGRDFVNDTFLGVVSGIPVPTGTAFVSICALNDYANDIFIQIDNIADSVSLNYETQEQAINPCLYTDSSECRTFNKILCIGDSLTAGQFDYKENGTTKEVNLPQYAYPTFLKSITGRDTTNAGDAGETTKTWYELHQNDDLSGHDACIIMLGRNDYVESRYTTTEERAQAFANIINKVRTENPQIKIFLSTLINYYTGTEADKMNADIRTAATANNCYLLDISQYGTLLFADEAYSHCTATGYYKLAEQFFNYISYVMHYNLAEFKTIQFAGTNRAY